MPILHHISANSPTCGSDAITFFGSMSSLEVTITVCHNLGVALVLPSKNRGGGGCTDLRYQLKNFQF